MLRIGGDSTDWTWWPVRGYVRPGGVSYNLGKGWLRTTHALAVDTGAKLILGINLATARPALATDEAQALLQGIGRSNVSALEIGNEPDLYGVFAWYRDRLNHVVLLPGPQLLDARLHEGLRAGGGRRCRRCRSSARRSRA